MKKFILTIICIGLPLKLIAGDEIQTRRKFNLFAGLSLAQNKIKTNESSFTSQANNSSTSISTDIGFDYFLISSLAVTGLATMAISSSLNSEIYGFDLGVRYYPFNKGYKSEVKILESTIESSPGLAPFVLLGYSNRNYQFSNSNVTFQGADLGIGADYHLSHQYFLRGAVHYQKLKNTSNRDYNGLTMAIALGMSF